MRRLFAAGFDGWSRREIGRKAFRRERFHIHLHKGDKRTAEIRQRAAASVDDSSGCRHYSSFVSNDLDRLLQPSTPRDHVFGNEESLSGTNDKASTEDQAARTILLRENMPFPQMAGHLLADDDPADGRRDNSRRRVGLELAGKAPANLRGNGGILQQQRALKELPAMQARAKNKVAVQKGSGPVKKIKNVVHTLIRKNRPIFFENSPGSGCKVFRRFSLLDLAGLVIVSCAKFPARLFLAAEERLPPLAIFEIPSDCFHYSFARGLPRFPAEFGPYLCRIDGVAPVVA